MKKMTARERREFLEAVERLRAAAEVAREATAQAKDAAEEAALAAEEAANRAGAVEKLFLNGETRARVEAAADAEALAEKTPVPKKKHRGKPRL